MDGVKDRTSELVRATLSAAGVTVCNETLFFCPLADFDGRRAGSRSRRIPHRRAALAARLRVDRVARLVEIESSARLLLDDDYFSLVPGAPPLGARRGAGDARRADPVTVAAWDGQASVDVAL